MRQVSIFLAVSGAALTLAAPGAAALTCDIVLDRDGTVIYQDVAPPVDLSDRGAAAREKMRQRGELLMIIEADQCPRLVISSVSGTASVDEIVAGMRPYLKVTGGIWGASAGPGGGGGGTTSAAPAGVAPAGRY